jgi:mycothiol synthase
LGPIERDPVRPVSTRAFVPGRDEDGWLRVNNDAFAWHPEQGGWDRERLEAALAEPWVDLAGIRMHDGEDGVVDAFCWTKVHDGDPSPDALTAVGSDGTLGGSNPGGESNPVGEIWVIAAHPSRHGTGLGTGIVVAGMDHLAQQGLDTISLWTEDDNVAARRTYDRLGFGLHQRRGGYAR